MKSKIALFLVGIALGLILSEYTTVYRMSCDTARFGWMWTNQKKFSENGFTCLHNEGQQVVRETSPYMIYQTIILELQ